MRYRVDELAARSGLTVDTVRYYHSKGLLPPPLREGRVAWYAEEHLTRLQRIRALKDNGLTLAAIQRLLREALGPADEALVAALSGPVPGEGAGLLSAEELAQRTGVSAALLDAVARQGLLMPREVGGQPRYTSADVDAVRAGMALLEAGVPLGELLDLARRYDEAMRPVAEEAVEMFVRFVRDPIQGSEASEQEASDRLVTAFRTMLPATGALVAHHFRRLLLSRAQARIERDGDAREVALARQESARMAGRMGAPMTEAL